MIFSLHRLIASLATLATWFASATVSANAMHVSTNGTGQVLLFPYYTARGGNVSLLSLVNTTTQAKAVRVNVREARGGFIVGQLNVYLSAKDVWTAAIVSDSEGARVVTNDKSCTAPLMGSSGLPFSADAYSADSLLSFRTRDRTREGYVEVIEMASIPSAKPTGIAVTHVAGVPPCQVGGTAITNIAYEPPAADLAAPTGGLTGSLSFVNVAKGMLASAPPTALDNFWLTGPGAPAPRAVPANASAMDLASGKNTAIAFSATDSTYPPSVASYTARFARSIDAVSAVLTGDAIYPEYAYTQNQVLGTLIMATMPTKPYYIHVVDEFPFIGVNAYPFSSTWNPATAEACDPAGVASYDREEGTPSSPDDFLRPPGPPSTVCAVANPLLAGGSGGGLPLADDTSIFSSPLSRGVPTLQNGGIVVKTPGKEGGWSELSWTSAVAKLTPLEASVYSRNDAGVLSWQPVKITLPGLPVIGFTLSQAAYQTGSPQQNYADAVPLRTGRNVTLKTP